MNIKTYIFIMILVLMSSESGILGSSIDAKIAKFNLVHSNLKDQVDEAGQLLSKLLNGDNKLESFHEESKTIQKFLQETSREKFLQKTSMLFYEIAANAKAVAENKSIWGRLNLFIFGNEHERDMDVMLVTTEKFWDTISETCGNLEMTSLNNKPKVVTIPKINFKQYQKNPFKNSQIISVPYSIEKE